MATLLTLLSLGFVCALLACITKRWNGGGLFDLQEYGYYVFRVRDMTLVGTVVLGIGMLLELFATMVKKLKTSTALNVVILICCIISVLELSSGLFFYLWRYSYSGYSLCLLTASVVFAMEALILNIRQWRRG